MWENLVLTAWKHATLQWLITPCNYNACTRADVWLLSCSFRHDLSRGLISYKTYKIVAKQLNASVLSYLSCELFDLSFSLISRCLVSRIFSRFVSLSNIWKCKSQEFEIKVLHDIWVSSGIYINVLTCHSHRSDWSFLISLNVAQAIRQLQQSDSTRVWTTGYQPAMLLHTQRIQRFVTNLTKNRK